MRERESERERVRERESEIDRDRERESEIDIERESEIDRERERARDRVSDTKPEALHLDSEPESSNGGQRKQAELVYRKIEKNRRGSYVCIYTYIYIGDKLSMRATETGRQRQGVRE